MEPPYVVKPVNQGSSVGVFIVRQGDNRPPEELRSDEWTLGDEVMVEEYVPGPRADRRRDGRTRGLGALAVTEIVPRTGILRLRREICAGRLGACRAGEAQSGA